jgi:hypothetical protein
MRARPPAVLHPPVSTGSAGRAARRLLLAFLVSAAAFSGGDAAVLTPQAPAITEPAFDDETVSAYDVHMVAGPFVGAPGENHVCTDWEIRTPYSDQIAWFASCVTGVLKVHIHLGDGAFTGPLAGQHQLETDSYYKLRVRFQGDAGPPESRWSDWAERMFHTAAGSAIQPLVLSEIAVIRSPTWRDEGSEDVVLPAGMPAPSVRLEVAGVGPLLVFEGLDGARNDVSNLPPLATHGPLHVAVSSGGADLALPASQVAFTDGSGEDRDVFLPPITLPAGQTAGFWISEGGGAFTADPAPGPGAEPVFGDPVSEPPVPWAVKQPGFRVDRVATGFQLPVNIAFVPNPGAAAGDPFYYVTELYGAVKVVTRGGEVSDYATDLLNFDPTGSFPGSGEKGLAGIVVEPATGDLFVSGVEAVPPVTDFHFPRVIRLHSEDGGLTAASQTTVLDFPDEPLGPSHQISNLTIGPDDKLYVHIGDGLLTTPAQDLTSVRGKILRVNLDGSAPADNPYYDASDGITATDLVFAYGFRNPFGGAWRATDGAHWEVENGPGVDRLAKVVAGRNYLWDGTDASMSNFASYVWPQSVAPVNIVFVQRLSGHGHGPCVRLRVGSHVRAGPAEPRQASQRVHPVSRRHSRERALAADRVRRRRPGDGDRARRRAGRPVLRRPLQRLRRDDADRPGGEHLPHPLHGSGRLLGGRGLRPRAPRGLVPGRVRRAGGRRLALGVRGRDFQRRAQSRAPVPRSGGLRRPPHGFGPRGRRGAAEGRVCGRHPGAAPVCLLFRPPSRPPHPPAPLSLGSGLNSGIVAGFR